MEHFSVKDPWTWTQQDFLSCSHEAEGETERTLWQALADNNCSGEILLTSVDLGIVRHVLGIHDLPQAFSFVRIVETLRRRSATYQSHTNGSSTCAYQQSSLILPFEGLAPEKTDDCTRWRLLETNPSGFEIVRADSFLSGKGQEVYPNHPGIASTGLELDQMLQIPCEDPTLVPREDTLEEPPKLQRPTPSRDDDSKGCAVGLSTILPSAGLKVETYFTCPTTDHSEDQSTISTFNPSKVLAEKIFVQKLLKRAFLRDYSATTCARERKSTVWNLYKKPQSPAILSLEASRQGLVKLIWSTSSSSTDSEQPILSDWFQRIDWEQRLAKHGDCIETGDLPPFGESDSEWEYSSAVLDEIDREQREEIKCKEQGRANHLTPERVTDILGMCEVKFENDWHVHECLKLDRDAYNLWQRFHALCRKDQQRYREQVFKKLNDTEIRHRKLYDTLTSVSYFSERAVEHQAESMRQTTYLEKELNYLSRLYDKQAKCPDKPIQPIVETSFKGLRNEVDLCLTNQSSSDEGSQESDTSSFLVDDIPNSQYRMEGEDSDQAGTDNEDVFQSKIISHACHSPEDDGPSATTLSPHKRRKVSTFVSNDNTSDTAAPRSLKGDPTDLLDLFSKSEGKQAALDTDEHMDRPEHDNIDEIFASVEVDQSREYMIDVSSSENEVVQLPNCSNQRKKKKRAKESVSESEQETVLSDYNKDLEGNERKRVINSASESEQENDLSSKQKRRKRTRPINQQAAARRRQQQQERELISQRARDQHTSQTADMIINPGDIETGFDIAIDARLASRLKPHQLEGIRFMWRETVMMSEVRGCLLAHTMGLGKTLQVITYVDTLGHLISTSKNWLPHELRRPHTLILCPASLVANWIQEITFWTPQNAMGRTFVPALDDNNIYRLQTMRDWKEEGGILVLSYTLFTALINNMKTTGQSMYQDPRLAAEAKSLLECTPRVVVADEAHMFKNDRTKLAIAVRRIKCNARIALTGSPLANNLMEYWAIMDWIEEGHLGSKRDFRNEFFLPIEAGNKGQSTRSQVRQGQRQLKMLLGIIGDKIDRRNLTCLRTLLPSKFEYVLFLKSTPLQKTLYNSYLEAVSAGSGPLITQQLFLISRLKLLCNFPGLLQPEYTGNGWINRTKPLKKRLGNCSSIAPSHLDTELDLDIADVENEQEVQGCAAITEQWWKTVLLKFGTQVDEVHASTKVSVLLAICRAARDQNDKVLVFSFSLPTIKFLKKLLTDHSLGPLRIITGASGAKHRVQDVASFNALEGYATCLISTKAGGQGLNMAQANRVVLFDHEFNPVWAEQAVGRAYRMGQTKTVHVYRLQIDGSFEIPLFQQALQKLGLTSKVVDKKNIQSVLKQQEGLGAYLHPIPDVDREPEEVEAIDDRLLQEVISECPSQVLSVEKSEAFHIEEDNELDAADLVEIQAKQEAYWRDQDRKKNGTQYVQPLPLMPTSGALATPSDLHGSYVDGPFAYGPNALTSDTYGPIPNPHNTYGPPKQIVAP